MIHVSEVVWQAQGEWPLLLLLQLLPLATALMLWWLKNSFAAKVIGLLAVSCEMLLAINLYRHFDITVNVMQFAEQWSLLPGYHAAVDGMSVIFILLSALLSLLLVLYIIGRQLDDAAKLFSIILATSSVLMTLFTTVNLLWFLVFSAIELLLAGYLLIHWSSSPEKDLARERYLQFMSAGLLLFAGGVMMLGWNYADATGGVWKFDLFDLLQVPVASHLQSAIFFLLFYGLAIRTPLFPLHGWLPIVAAHGNVALAPVILLGLKVGIYGMLRFMFPLVPEAINEWHLYVTAFAVAGVFYAAILAFMQRNMRRLLAYAVISHTSILIIGLFSLGHTAFQGSVLLAVNFGLATAGLLFMSGFVFRRTGSMLLSRLGGLFDTIPIIGITFLIAGLSIVGMPGTPGFDAVHLILEAAMERNGALVTIAAALGNVFAAGFLLWAFQRAFLTPRQNKAPEAVLETTTPHERLVSLLLILVLVVVGFYSEPWLELIDAPLNALHELYNPHE